MSSSPRLASIDVFRAVTMLMMIFVNDLWTLKNIPGWLEHTTAEADGMGLADTVFPAFLFIVGLSIPFALQSRVSRGASTSQSLIYILTRSFALLLMGFFHVNLEDYSHEAVIPKPVWQILITVGFFLVFLDYSSATKKTTKVILQTTGSLLLVVMAILYKGNHNGLIVGMRPQWWGILGLIGWSYLLAAVIFLFIKEKLVGLIVAWAFFMLFNIAVHSGLLTFLKLVRQVIWIVGDGSLPAFVVAGILTAVIYRKFAHNEKMKQYTFTLVLIGIGMMLLGFALRPIGGISKIRATPSWTAICTGINMLIFVLLIVIVDIKNKRNWFSAIRPAGTSTLTCYLLPYVYYALYSIIGFTLPVFMRNGMAGIFKSLAFAMLIILITGLLEKKRIRLRI